MFGKEINYVTMMRRDKENKGMRRRKEKLKKEIDKENNYTVTRRRGHEKKRTKMEERKAE